METPFKGVNYINESVLDREARRKEEKNNMLLNKRQHLMKRRELLGFPPRYPSLAKYEDYEDTCDSSSKNKGDMKAQGETLNARLASEDEKRLQRYLFTTSYQA
ncbi:unnamed protein product [Trichobilharzia regenti]|nr:unnamed protein product [Trichobilharzia regenti]